MNAASADPLLGVTLGSYVLRSRIGEGGMGAVYLAEHPGIGSRVAVKVLSQQCARNADLVERFFGEARAVTHIGHEGIVNILDLAHLPDGRPYIVMEHLQGRPLSALLAAHGRLPLGTATSLALEVLSALGAAHDKGVVHRDLKPDNVFITDYGRVKLLDFGVAKLLPQPESPDSGQRTQTGALLGTPSYMAPEQITGAPVGPATDFYAMGVMLFEAVTGSLPFSAGTLYELMELHVHAPPPSPQSLRPELPVAYERLILQALEKAPERRAVNAADMSRQLAAVSAELAQNEWVTLTSLTGTAPAVIGTPPPSTRIGVPQLGAPVATPAADLGGAATEVDPAPPSGLPRAGAGALTVGVVPGPSPMPSPPPAVGPPGPMQPPAVAPPGPVAAGPGESRRAEPLSGGAGPQKRSRAGLWVAVAALVVVSSVVIAVVAASGGGTTGDQNESVASGTSEQAAGGNDDSAGGVGDDSDRAGNGTPGEVGTDPAGGAGGTGSTAPVAHDGGPPRVLAEPKEVDPGPAKQQIGGVVIINGAATAAAQSGIAPAVYRRGHEITYDAKAFDAIEFLPLAEKLARRRMSDAFLVEFDVPNLYPTGRADLHFGDDESATFEFRSPSRSVRPTDIPAGAEVELVCMMYVEVYADRVEVYAVSDEECDDKQRPTPSCSLAQVWERARLEGAPNLSNAIASVDYLWDGWSFSFGDATADDHIYATFPDDCQNR